MRTNKLTVEYDYDFTLLGLISPIKHYKLAWVINQELHIELSREEEQVIYFKDNKTAQVAFFSFETETSRWNLIRNRLFEPKDGKPSFLLPEMNHLDYIMRIDGDPYPQTIDKIIEILKGLPSVQYLAALDINKLKSKENLLIY